MTSQSIVAVVLPNGVASGGRVRANVYLTPRLSGASTLSHFPDWLHWTDLVHRHGLHLTLECAGSSRTVAVDRSVLRPDVWDAVFGHDSRVAEYPSNDADQRLIVSYPSRVAHDYLRYAYQRQATSLVKNRDGHFGDLLEDLVFRSDQGSTLDDTLSRLRVRMWEQQQGTEPGSGTTTGSGTSTGSDLGGTAPPEIHAASAPPLLGKPAGTREMAERLALYHRLPPAPTRPPLPSTPDELAGLIDFHQALTAITGYPTLLPALGLVFAVELPAGFCPTSPDAGAYLTMAVTAIEPGWTWTDPPALAAPRTAFVRGPHAFVSAPASSPAEVAAGTYRTADVVDGFLALSATDFHLVGVDIDGALLKAMALADSLENAQDATLADGLLPSLRSSGLALLADDRARQLLDAIHNNQGFETALSGGTSAPLTAPDVTRGYRIDIWTDRGAQWRSLHRRDGSYRFGTSGLVVQTEDEEGFTQLAVVQPADDPGRPEDPIATAAGVPQPATDLYLNERVARWNGWSLSAPRPGTPLNRSPDPARALEDDPTVQQSVTSFHLSTSFAAHAGSLPTLRFGSRYRIRARAVDLAGDSVPLGATAPDELVAPAGGALLPYFRFEPVPPPTLVLRALPGLGASLHEMVIRSHNSDPSLDAVPVGDQDDRHVAPPKTSVQLVENHGLLDDAAGHVQGDPATYQLITTRDRGDIPVVGSDPLEPADVLAVTYFPDPIARGAALVDLPHTAPDTDGSIDAAGTLNYGPPSGDDPRPTSVTHVPFGSDWPQRHAFLLRLVDGHAAPVWDAGARVLTVSLRKGEVVDTTVSCFVEPADLDLLGVWEWMRQVFEAGEAVDLLDTDAGPLLVSATHNRGLLTRLVLDGTNEFITPTVPLRLTHATQQPLGRPSFTRLPVVHDPASPIVAAALANAFSPVIAWRSHGSHHAVLLGALQINGATTASIDLEARWIDWIDDVTEPGPTKRQGAGPVERITLSLLEQATVPADGIGDRQVAVYLPSIDTLWFAAPFDQLDGVDPPPAVAAPVHHLGDTLHRSVRYRAVASSRFAEYFPEPGSVTSRPGPALTVDVPSSARPLAPDIAYVVPTFRWQRQVTTNTKTDVRVGNGLRVYLRRPWYSSGVGELLGVVLWPESSPPPSDDQRELAKTIISQWGLDPIWATGELADVPDLSTFPAASHVGRSRTLAESPQLVDVAGHDVGYDADRRLWYADIDFDNPDAYAPFVRLALARYQPRSIDGVELSSVILADFAQLTATRSAAMTIDPADPQVARVVVAGVAPSGPTRSYVTVTAEQRRPDIEGDLGWGPAKPAQIQVVEDSPAASQPESVLWAGSVRFAHRVAPGTARIVVREFEVIEIDPPPTGAFDGAEYGARLVYASVLTFDYPFVVGRP